MILIQIQTFAIAKMAVTITMKYFSAHEQKIYDEIQMRFFSGPSGKSINQFHQFR